MKTAEEYEASAEDLLQLPFVSDTAIADAIARLKRYDLEAQLDLKHENEELRNKLTTYEGQTNWQCQCGGSNLLSAIEQAISNEGK